MGQILDYPTAEVAQPHRSAPLGVQDPERSALPPQAALVPPDQAAWVAANPDPGPEGEVRVNRSEAQERAQPEEIGNPRAPRGVPATPRALATYPAPVSPAVASMEGVLPMESELAQAAMPEAPPESGVEWSMEMVEEPVHLDPERSLRIEVDADLALEVQLDGEGAEIVLEGTAKALEPLEELDRELRSSLRDNGSDLREFSQRERKERDEHRGAYNAWSNREVGQDSQDETVGNRGSVINAVA